MVRNMKENGMDKKMVYVNFEAVRYIIVFDDWLRYFFGEGDFIDLPRDAPIGTNLCRIELPKLWDITHND